ncbi:NAD(P)/FAD-dependent oxidoreductase [Microbacterium sp. CH12i]|uniref:NAD(P)/FAD-dependent oxidoreductase n=1 Tax=Microbacterium sp. CH12i TaxID=1479651 RepID=UPI00068DBC41|nr:FAD-dependent oxidoreductase [Microbacterium sp. CH12i]
MSTPHAAADASSRHRIVVIGGGNAGLSVAGRLRHAGISDIAVIDPNDTHYYKPLFSHVAGGTAKASETMRAQADVIPKGVDWIQGSVTSVDADAHEVRLASGATVAYEHVIVCPGIVHDWDTIPGLTDAMRSPEGASNYELDLAVKASALLRDVRGGTVVFVQASGPASCAGAAQKPMYTTEEHLAYDVLLVEPPQSAPKWIGESGLASEPGGFVDVDVRTLRSSTHPDVWALGDAAATTNSKSGGALRKQTKILADNLLSVLSGREPTAHYDGYGVCPFTVSRSTPSSPSSTTSDDSPPRCGARPTGRAAVRGSSTAGCSLRSTGT